jgi:phosphatidylglycerophosphate synthase
VVRLPSREEYFARWAGGHGGYDPGRSGLVGGWLRLVYVCARPFAAVGAPPDVITFCGLAVSAAAVWAAAGGWLWLAALLVVVAGLLDNLDGAVAVLTDRSSAWGQVLDSTVDRCSDALFLLALWAAGAPVAVCVGAGVAAGLLEYLRARAAVAGVTEIAVVTVAERPTRVIVTAAFLAAAALHPENPAWWAAVGAWVFLVVSTVGLLQLIAAVHRRLTKPPTI